MYYVILFESSAAYRLHRNLTSPAPPGLHPLRAALSAHELWLCRRIIIPYLWSSQGRAAKLGVQTDRTRSRGICRGHGVSSDVLAKVRMSQIKSVSICVHYTYCRKYPNPITKNFSFFLKFFSSFYVRQVGRYAARWRPVFRSAVLRIDTKAR